MYEAFQDILDRFDFRDLPSDSGVLWSGGGVISSYFERETKIVNQELARRYMGQQNGWREYEGYAGGRSVVMPKAASLDALICGGILEVPDGHYGFNVPDWYKTLNRGSTFWQENTFWAEISARYVGGLRGGVAVAVDGSHAYSNHRCNEWPAIFTNPEIQGIRVLREKLSPDRKRFVEPDGWDDTIPVEEWARQQKTCWFSAVLEAFDQNFRGIANPFSLAADKGDPDRIVYSSRNPPYLGTEAEMVNEALFGLRELTLLNQRGASMQHVREECARMEQILDLIKAYPDMLDFRLSGAHEKNWERADFKKKTRLEQIARMMLSLEDNILAVEKDAVWERVAISVRHARTHKEDAATINDLEMAAYRACEGFAERIEWIPDAIESALLDAGPTKVFMPTLRCG